MSGKCKGYGPADQVLAFETLPAKPFLERLRDSGIPFVEVPQLDDGLLAATGFPAAGMQ